MENKSKDIAVFTLARGSQINDYLQNSESYQFVYTVLKNMMSNYGMDVPKVGIGGDIEDVSCFIAGLIEYQTIFEVKVELIEGDTTEFDPDSNPEVYDDEWG